MSDLPSSLPAYLALSPHLSAHKYLVVCSLTVLTWDTLVLSPRTWTLFKSEGWPLLKILYHFVRWFVVAEFIIVAVAFFDTDFSVASCQKFYLFEPICTTILLAATSAIHVVRMNGIYDKSRPILFGLAALLGLQVVVDAISSAFFRVVPLLPTQGCIAGPKSIWVGIYWVLPTIFYATTFALAMAKSITSLKTRPVSLWKLMLRDGLNLYASILIVNLANVLFWFIITPTGDADSIRTILTSLTAILTTTMTMRIVLAVRGTLAQGGVYSGSTLASSTSRANTHGVSANSRSQPTYTIDESQLAASKNEHWSDTDKNSVSDDQKLTRSTSIPESHGIKVTIDREVVYDTPYGYAQ